VRYIGDVHGKWDTYRDIIADCDESIQVGDFGIGFRPFGSEPYSIDPVPGFTPGPMFERGHRFIRGNHDNPTACKIHPNWIPDGTVEGDTMFIGGAISIDKDWREPEINYWEDEELSYQELSNLIVKYEQVKPRVMVTHEAPESVINHAMPFYQPGRFDSGFSRNAFDSMFAIHKPELWIFGHWHYGVDVNILGTRFICLPELGYVDL
jgi:hypothetical protein